MIQVAQNGARAPGSHPALPLTLDELVMDAVACAAAGAFSVHLHPRRPADRRQSLHATVCDPVVTAIRKAAPGVQISLSTAVGISLDGAADRVEAVSSWRSPPDVVSVNLCEPASIELGSALLAGGIGIEAGIFDLTDADALLAAPWARAVTRVLVETIHERDDEQAVALAHAIDARVAPLGRPCLWHGIGHATWAVVDAGIAAGRDVRVGLEDSLVGRDGDSAPTNPEQVAEALRRR